MTSVTTVDTDPMLDTLQGMDADPFEYFLGELYGWNGEWETRVTQSSNDQGIDVVLDRPGTDETVAVQAKRYGPNTTVSRPEVQQYAGLKQQFDFDDVYVVTTSTFTAGARKAAQQAGVRLVNGADLCRLVREKDAESLVERYTGQTPAPATRGGQTGGGQRTGSRQEAVPLDLFWGVVVGLAVFGYGMWFRVFGTGGEREGAIAVLVGYVLLTIAVFFDEGYARIQQASGTVYTDEVPHVASMLIALWLPVTLGLGFAGLGPSPDSLVSAVFYYLPLYPLVVGVLYLLERQLVLASG